MNDREAVLEAISLVKTFSDAGRNVEVLRGVELRVGKGDRVAIIGASGSGKTTLLQLLGGLDEPTSGEVRVIGTSMTKAADAEPGLRILEASGWIRALPAPPSQGRGRPASPVWETHPEAVR